jgi:hypothetical protein
MGQGETVNTLQKLAGGAFVTAVVLGVSMSCSDDSTAPTFAAQAFVAVLAGANERPNAVTTTAAGRSDVTILDTNLIKVQLFVSTIDSVTQSHIHAGDATVAGPVMVFLLSLVPAGRPNITGTDQLISTVEINRSTPVCVGNGIPTPCFLNPYTLDSLMFRIKNNVAYTNVHTRKNGGGEIRGQIVPK